MVKKEYRNTKLTIEEVRKRIESSSDCKLLSTEYIDRVHNLKIQCGCGEVFEKTIGNFKHGKKMCRKCSRKKPALNYGQVKEYIESEGHILISEKYDGSATPIEVSCIECGNTYSVLLYYFKNSLVRTCNDCSRKRQASDSMLGYDYVKSEVEKDGCKLISETYNGSASKLNIKCHCGEVFENSFAEMRVKKIRQCSKCGYIASGKKLRMGYDAIKRYIEVESESGCTLISTDCDYGKDFIDIKCHCGDVFNTTLERFKHLDNKECGKCSGVIMWDIDMVRDYVRDNSECELVSTVYTTSNDKMDFRCSCGNIFTTQFAKFSGVQDKKQCNECSGKSKLERYSTLFFKDNSIEYIPEKTFDDCINIKTNYKLRYDFYLPKYNTLIECDGIQHFKPTRFHQSMTEEDIERNFVHRQYLDSIKNQYALDNNINLIRIPYWELDNIDQVLNEIIKELESKKKAS